DGGEEAGATGTGQLALYGVENYDDSLDGKIYITTPITADSGGNIFFGFQVTGSTSLNLRSGIARMSPDGQGAWVAAGRAAGDPALDHAVYNGAPALSNDESTRYVTIHTGSSGRGRPIALDTTTPHPV